MRFGGLDRATPLRSQGHRLNEPAFTLFSLSKTTGGRGREGEKMGERREQEIGVETKTRVRGERPSRESGVDLTGFRRLQRGERPTRESRVDLTGFRKI